MLDLGPPRGMAYGDRREEEKKDEFTAPASGR